MEHECQTVSSVDLRAATEGEFHPVTVRDSFAVQDGIFSSDRAVEPATEPEDARTVCAVIEHPNGDVELAYEYVDTCIRHGQSTLSAASAGDTLWIADWEAVFDPILTPADRDYAIVADRPRARAIKPRRDPIDASILRSMAVLTATTIPAAAMAMVALANGLATLFAGAVAIAVAGWLGHRRLAGDIDAPYERVQSALVEPDVPTGDVPDTPDITAAIARRANAFDSWELVDVEDADTDAGVVTCTHPGLGEPLQLSFDSPRKWDADEYTLVELAERVGVGSVEQLVGEQLEVRRDQRESDGHLRDADGDYCIRPVGNSRV